jgi:hypothetical protein
MKNEICRCRECNKKIKGVASHCWECARLDLINREEQRKNYIAERKKEYDEPNRLSSSRNSLP